MGAWRCMKQNLPAENTNKPENNFQSYDLAMKFSKKPDLDGSQTNFVRVKIHSLNILLCLDFKNVVFRKPDTDVRGTSTIWEIINCLHSEFN